MDADFTLDADTFIHLRSLDLIEVLEDACRRGLIRLRMTGYVANNELNRLAPRVTALKAAGMEVHQVSLSSPEGRRFREMQQEAHYGKRNKGERESIAWLSTGGVKGSIYVAHDNEARQLAIKESILAMDLLEMLCCLHEIGAVSSEKLSEALADWSNPHAGNGCPANYSGLEAALKQYRIKWEPRALIACESVSVQPSAS